MMFKYARKMAFAAIAMIFSTATLAAAYPDKPVRMIVPFPPGGSTDIMARVLSNTLQQQMGQPFVVQNRAGAGGVIGTDAAAKSDPDGYTILLSSSAPLAVGLDLYKNIPYDVLQDLVPVSMVGEVPMVLVTNPDFEAKTLPQLIGYARANPGKLTFALNALGSQSHLLTELFQVRTGTSINMIPYKGSSPAVADLLGGVVAANFENLPVVLEHIKSGRLRAVAVLSPERLGYLPDVPTFTELGMKEFVASPWFAMVAPKGTPPEIVKTLNENINKALASDQVKDAFSKQGASPIIQSPEATGRFIKAEIGKWSTIVKETGAKLQ